MLGSLPKLLDRNFVLGFFLPALLFSVAALLLLHEYEFAYDWLSSILAKDVTATAYAVAIVWLLAIILLVFNHPIYRFWEGYLPPLSWRRRAARRTWCQVNQWQNEANDLRARYKELSPKEISRYDRLRGVLSKFPATEDNILPTRFGNAIRNFETYSYDVYGADSVVIWPRLLPVASKEYGLAVEGARATVDFFLNCCVLALWLAAIALGVLIIQTNINDVLQHLQNGWLLSTHSASQNALSVGGLLNFWGPVIQDLPFGKLIWFAIALLAAKAFYCCAVCAVPAWGAFVKAGFDCYLPKLADQLGYALPKNECKRRQFWEQYSAMLTYRTLPNERPFFKPEDWLFSARH